MSDDLHEILKKTDAAFVAPGFDASNLANQIRHSMRVRRRLAACGLASAAILLALAPFTVHHPKQNQIVNPNWDAALHVRVGSILLSETPRSKSSVDSRDLFLTELRMQRNRAALLLLLDTESDTPSRAASLQRTIDLFPETPSAAVAIERLRRLGADRRQS